MEIAFLNAILRSPNSAAARPVDVRIHAISYYYLGYLLLAIVTRLAAIAPTVAFNLGNAGGSRWSQSRLTASSTT